MAVGYAKGGNLAVSPYLGTPPDPLYRGQFADILAANAAITDGALGEYVTIGTPARQASFDGTEFSLPPTDKYKGEIADTPALLASGESTIGSEYWVLDGGSRKRGAFKQLLRLPSTTGANWSGWFGDIEFTPQWDSTQDDWSTTGMTLDATA